MTHLESNQSKFISQLIEELLRRSVTELFTNSFCDHVQRSFKVYSNRNWREVTVSRAKCICIPQIQLRHVLSHFDLALGFRLLEFQPIKKHKTDKYVLHQWSQKMEPFSLKKTKFCLSNLYF